jgi:hypothetical protein
MVASDPDMEYDGALSANHAFTIHEVRPVIDYWAAVDEDQKRRGAGHVDEALYISGTFYRNYSVNLDLVKRNLPNLTPGEIRDCVEISIRSIFVAVPKGKLTSTNGHTPLGRCLGLVREKATSLSLAGAFERPVYNGPYIETGWDRLTQHWNNLKNRLGREIGSVLCEPVYSTDPAVVGSMGIDDFCKEILKHV